MTDAPGLKAAPAPVASTPARPKARWSSSFVGWGAGVFLLVVAATVAWLAQRQADGGTGRPGAPTRLAVMPLQVVAGPTSKDPSYIGVGIADAITTRLAGIRQIGVRPTSAVLPYKDVQSNPVHIASSLGVQHLLMGSIQPSEHTYRISVQLVRADGVAVWGKIYDEPRAGLLQLQDHMAEQVASALRIELSPPERARLHVRSGLERFGSRSISPSTFVSPFRSGRVLHGGSSRHRGATVMHFPT